LNENNSLVEAYKQTNYKIAGHGKRETQVLKTGFSEVDWQTESDMYGKGKLIEDFQTKMEEYLGKESAVFFPSGTMAQQIALRIWCDQKGLKKNSVSSIESFRDS
jgi:threonine aldolase